VDWRRRNQARRAHRWPKHGPLHGCRFGQCHWQPKSLVSWTHQQWVASGDGEIRRRESVLVIRVHPRDRPTHRRKGGRTPWRVRVATLWARVESLDRLSATRVLLAHTAAAALMLPPDLLPWQPPAGVRMPARPTFRQAGSSHQPLTSLQVKLSLSGHLSVRQAAAPRTAPVAVEAVEEAVEQRVERLPILELRQGKGKGAHHDSFRGRQAIARSRVSLGTGCRLGPSRKGAMARGGASSNGGGTSARFCGFGCLGCANRRLRRLERRRTAGQRSLEQRNTAVAAHRCIDLHLPQDRRAEGSAIGPVGSERRGQTGRSPAGQGGKGKVRSRLGHRGRAADAGEEESRAVHPPTP
jgi:hypothetical protein